MTDKQLLREVSKKAKHAGEAPVMPFDQRISALQDFQRLATPDTVLSLLDELEASEKRNECALSLLSDASTEKVWDVIGRLKVVISGDYRSEKELNGEAPQGA